MFFFESWHSERGGPGFPRPRLWADHLASPQGSSEEPEHEARGREGMRRSPKEDPAVEGNLQMNCMIAISMKHLQGGAPPMPTSVGSWRGRVDASVRKRLGQSGRRKTRCLERRA